MSNTAIKLKKSSVVGKAPIAGDLQFGEIAINYADGRIYYKNSSNTIKNFVDSDLVKSLIDVEIARLTILDSASVRGQIEDYLNGDITTDLIPSVTETYSLGSPSKRFLDLYLAGTTINIGGATISSDGTGQIQISGQGAVLPAGSRIAVTDSDQEQIAIVGQSGSVEREVPFFTQSGGLGASAATFRFRASPEGVVFRNFTFTNGETITTAADAIQFHF